MVFTFFTQFLKKWVYNIILVIQIGIYWSKEAIKLDMNKTNILKTLATDTVVSFATLKVDRQEITQPWSNFTNLINNQISCYTWSKQWKAVLLSFRSGKSQIQFTVAFILWEGGRALIFLLCSSPLSTIQLFQTFIVLF